MYTYYNGNAYTQSDVLEMKQWILSNKPHTVNSIENAPSQIIIFLFDNYYINGLRGWQGLKGSL